MKLDITQQDQAILNQQYDPKNKGLISFTTFMDKVVGRLEGERLAISEDIWATIDQQRHDRVPSEFIQSYF